MSDPLLTYALFTSPEVLQASPSNGQPSIARLTIVVSNNTSKAIDVSSISFSFLEGSNAKDFFTDATGIAASASAGWSITSAGGVFEAKPDTPENGKVGGAGLTFELSQIKVNAQVGTSNMTITEVTVNGNIGTRTELLSKFPPQFQVGDLNVTPTPPVIQGDKIVLAWSGSDGATYQLQYEDYDGNTVTIDHPKGEPDQPLPSTGSYEIDQLQRSTTFYLIVTVPVEDEDQSPQLTRYAPVDVNVANPNITLFRGTISSITSAGVAGSLNWNAAHADSCFLTGDFNSLKTSTADDPYPIQLASSEAANKSWTLTANRSGAKADTSELTLSCQPGLLGSAAGGGGLFVMPDNSSVYVLEYDTNLWIVDAHSLQAQKTISNWNIPLDGALGVAATNDRQTFFLAWPSYIRSHDGNTLQPKQTAEVGSFEPGCQMAMALSPDNRRLYYTRSTDQALWVLDPSNIQQVPAPTKLGFAPLGLAVSADITRLYVTGGDQTLRVFDAVSLKLISEKNLGIQMQYVAISNDNLRLYISADQSLCIYDPNTLTLVAGPFPIGQHENSGMAGLGVSPDNQRLYASFVLSGMSMYSTFSFSGGR